MGAVDLHIRQFPELLNLVVHFMTQCALVVNRENEKGLPDPDNRRTLSSPMGAGQRFRASARGTWTATNLPAQKDDDKQNRIDDQKT